MKKILKNFVLLSMMGIIVFMTTGCGNDKEKNKEPDGETITATKSVKDEEEIVSMGGDYEETVEVKFVDDEVYNAVWTFKCEEEETAKTISSLYSMAKMEYTGIKIKEDGKKVVVTFDKKSFAAIIGEEDLSKKSVIEYFNENDYTVK